MQKLEARCLMFKDFIEQLQEYKFTNTS